MSVTKCGSSKRISTKESENSIGQKKSERNKKEAKMKPKHSHTVTLEKFHLSSHKVTVTQRDAGVTVSQMTLQTEDLRPL
jgi:hypothetical protein